MPEQQIGNPLGAFGYTDLQTQLWCLEAPFVTSAAVTDKRCVAMNTIGQVAIAATNGTAALVVGIAQDAAPAGGVCMVIVMGIAEDVPCNGAVAAGDTLKRSVTTSGSVATSASPAVGELIGVAMNASASNVVDVWVCKSPSPIS